MKKKAIIFYIAALVLMAAAPRLAAAQTYQTPNLWPTGFWAPNGLITCTGDYSATSTGKQCADLCDLIDTIINIVYFAMSIAIFILAPIFFVAGGIMIMVSGARPEMMGTGKKMLTGTVIGILIILASYLIVNSVIYYLGITHVGGFGDNGACTVAPPPSSFIPSRAGGVASNDVPWHNI